MERFIRLRRPAVLSVADAPFVPDGGPGLLAEVDRRWAALCAAKPSFYDGRLCHVIGVHRNGHGGATLHVADCAYRMHAVQGPDFDIGVRSLGVTGLTVDATGRVLFGLRAREVAGYAGLWEPAPCGVLEPAEAAEAALVREMTEETGLAPALVREVTALAVVYDEVMRGWELIYRISIDADTPTVTPAPGEYDELHWCERGRWPHPLTPFMERAIEPLLGRGDGK